MPRRNNREPEKQKINRKIRDILIRDGLDEELADTLTIERKKRKYREEVK